MDVSTIDPDTGRKLEDLLTAAGRRFVACPLGKGPAQAEAGTLTLFVGCDKDLLDELAPAFACIGDGIHYLGTVEAATTFKIVSNMVGMANLAVLAEGYALARRCDVGDDAFVDALRDTGAWSYQADLRLPLMINGDFGTRFAVDLALKDVRLAVDWPRGEDFQSPSELPDSPNWRRRTATAGAAKTLTRSSKSSNQTGRSPERIADSPGERLRPGRDPSPGASLRRCDLRLADDTWRNIVLGYANLDGYRTERGKPGMSIGRHTNRIARGRTICVIGHRSEHK